MMQEMDVAERAVHDRMSRIGKKLLVLSGKGGVGKSTVAANLAVALARAGKRVGLLDVDVHGPSIPGLLGLGGQGVEILGSALIPVRASENLLVMSVGFLLEGADAAVIWRGPRKYGVIRQMLGEVEWGELDYLVIDSPPGTGDEPLAAAQLVGAGASALIVTTPQALAIADVRRCVTFCERLDLPIAGIVENMSGFVCPHCGENVDVFRRGGGAQLASDIGAPFLGRIPIDPEIVLGGDAGAPILDATEPSEAGDAFARITAAILGSGEQENDETLESETEGNHSMKIAIPLAAGRLCAHFGHCEEFAVAEIDPDGATVSKMEKHQPPPHEPGVLPRWLSGLGVTTIIAGGMGQRAQDLFAENDIEVVVGAPADAPEDLIAAYLSGALEAGENVCDH